MATNLTRENIRRAHRPDADGNCLVRQEPYPCSVVVLLAELDTVEAVARNMQREMARLGAEITALRSRMNAAIELLSPTP